MSRERGHLARSWDRARPARIICLVRTLHERAGCARSFKP
jgi:hypothetical protein